MLEFYIEGSRPDGSVELMEPQQDCVLSQAIAALRRAMAAAPQQGICSVKLMIALPYSSEAEAIYAEHMKVKEENERKSMRRANLPKRSK